jgi:uncharacterized protein (TIGR00255 family)
MTGYAHAERADERRNLSIDVRSVNNRYLEVYVSLPSFLAPLEPDVKRMVSRYAVRGKVEVQIRLREYQSDLTIHVDERVVAAAAQALARIAETAGIAAAPGYSDLLAFDGVIQSERTSDPEHYREEIIEVLTEALAAWDDTRSAEGEATAGDIARHIGRVRAAMEVFAAGAPETEQLVYQTIRTRFREVLGDEADEQRMMAEAAALMVKHATNEEIARLKSHLHAFETVAAERGSVGKRLDFICQEMNREINTTGSKTVSAAVQEAVVEAKDAVESIREQVRNVE